MIAFALLLKEVGLTGISVVVGTVCFPLCFKKACPLSAVSVVIAGGAALMAICGILFSKSLHHYQSNSG